MIKCELYYEMISKMNKEVLPKKMTIPHNILLF